MKMISAKQIKIIWSIWRGTLKLDRGLLYERIAFYGAEKMHDLSYNDAEEFIRELESSTSGAGKLSAAQRRKLLGLKRQLDMSEEYFHNYMKKVGKVENIDWLTWKDARILIGAMSRSLKYKRKAADGRNI